MHEEEYQVVGKPVERTDGRVKVTGKARYAGTSSLRACSTARF